MVRCLPPLSPASSPCPCLPPFTRLGIQGSRLSGGGRPTPGGGGKLEPASLGLSDGSELLVEEQGAASKLITEGCASLADMEVSGRRGGIGIRGLVTAPGTEERVGCS